MTLGEVEWIAHSTCGDSELFWSSSWKPFQTNEVRDHCRASQKATGGLFLVYQCHKQTARNSRRLKWNVHIAHSVQSKAHFSRSKQLKFSLILLDVRVFVESKAIDIERNVSTASTKPDLVVSVPPPERPVVLRYVHVIAFNFILRHIIALQVKRKLVCNGLWHIRSGEAAKFPFRTKKQTFHLVV